MKLLSKIKEPLYIKRLKSEDYETRDIAVEKLGRIRTKRAFNALCKAFDDERDFVLQQLIVQSIGKTHVEEAYDYLFNILNDSEKSELDYAAIRALGHLQDKRSVDRVISIIYETDDPEIILACLFTLGELKDPRGVEPIIKILLNDDFNTERWIGGPSYRKNTNSNAVREIPDEAGLALLKIDSLRQRWFDRSSSSTCSTR